MTFIDGMDLRRPEQYNNWLVPGVVKGLVGSMMLSSNAIKTVLCFTFLLGIGWGGSQVKAAVQPSSSPVQSKSKARKRTQSAKSQESTDGSSKTEQGTGSKLSKAKSDLVNATQDYKKSLANLLPYEETAVKNATNQVQTRQALFEKGIVSRKEVDDSKLALAQAQSKLDETKKQLAEADSMLAEVEEEQEVKVPSAVGKYSTTAAMIRYNGPLAWSLKDAGKVETFFESEFGHNLPISAFGQTAVHDHLGFDHHNAMDVALSPDSAQGEALMEYLRKQGIPFIAFRRAVPGSATGAHIHIGQPSHRITVRASASGGK